MIRAIRPRKCCICRNRFTPRTSFAVVCSPKCSMVYIDQQAEKRARAEKRAGRIRLMTRRDWMKRAQVAFNAFIRARDEGLPCICCGRFADDKDLITGSRWDAGHYRSTGSAPHLRFAEDNCHRQLVRCNRHGSGRAVDYRIGLIKRIGLARVEALEADQTSRKFTIDELKAIEATYKAKARELRNAKGAA